MSVAIPLAFLAVSTRALHAQVDTIVLNTGSPNGVYQQLGLAIQQLAATEMPGIHIEVQRSLGSVDNVRALENGKAQLAIIQGDVAHYAVRGEEMFQDHPFRGMRAVIGLHYEPVLVIARRQLNLRTVSDISRGMRVVVGEKGSGTRFNARDVLSASGLSLEDVKSIDQDPRRGLRLLRVDSADVVFLTSSLGRDLLAEIAKSDGVLLALTPDITAQLTDSRPYYEDVTIEALGERVRTVQIRSILVARATESDRFIAQLTAALYGHIENLRASAPGAAGLSAGSLADLHAIDFHPGAMTFYCGIGLLPCNHAFAYVAMFAAVLTLGVIVLVFSGRARAKVVHMAPGVTARLIGPRGLTDKFKIIIIPIFVLTTLTSSAYVIQVVERAYAQRYNLHSDFEDIGLNQNLLWLLIFATTGFAGDRFPKSPAGKLTSAAQHWISTGGVLLLVALLTSQTIARRLRMTLHRHPSYLSDHVIIVGWNRQAVGVARGLADPALQQRRQYVVLVAETVPNALEQLAKENSNFEYVVGSPADNAVLERAGIAAATTVLILSDESSAEPDAKTLLALTRIEKLAHRLLQQGERKARLRTIVQMSDPANRDVMTSAHADLIVCTGEFDQMLYYNSVLNPGVSAFLQDVLTVSDTNELIEVPVSGSEPEPVSGLTFDELLAAGRAHGVLLVAINRGGAPGFMHKGFAKRGAEMIPGNALGMLANPFSDHDRRYRINKGDSLLFLAESEKPLERIFGDSGKWKRAFRKTAD